MIGYRFYIVEDNAANFLVVENRDTDTWEAAILDWDISEGEAKEAAKSFLSGDKEPCADEDGNIWAEDKEHLLPECAKFFEFREMEVVE